MQQGWIKLHRKIQSHWIYQEERKFSRYEAWLDLIVLANHKDNKLLLDGELKDIKKGQLITSIKKLCDKWDWSNTKVMTFLKLLQDDGMIAYNSDTKKTLITIVNYGVYHTDEEEKATQKHNENTSETYQKHIRNTQTRMLKNVLRMIRRTINVTSLKLATCDWQNCSFQKLEKIIPVIKNPT